MSKEITVTTSNAARVRRIDLDQLPVRLLGIGNSEGAIISWYIPPEPAIEWLLNSEFSLVVEVNGRPRRVLVKEDACGNKCIKVDTRT